MENLNLAFDIAEKYLDIPRMLDPEGNITVSVLVRLHLLPVATTGVYGVIIK